MSLRFTAGLLLCTAVPHLTVALQRRARRYDAAHQPTAVGEARTPSPTAVPHIRLFHSRSTP